MQSKFYLSIVVVFLMCFLSTAGFSQTFLHRGSKSDKAMLCHYKSIKLVQDGKLKKAKRMLRKAIKYDTRNEFFIDLASIYAKEGKIKKAYYTMDKVKIQDNCPSIKKVEFLAWKAYYALSLGLCNEPHSNFNQAIYKMKMYGIDSTKLMSNLYNNSAVSRIFDQYMIEGSKPLVHYNDYRQARRKLIKALEYDSTNCFAQYNLDIVETVLKIPQDSMSTVKYVIDSLYDWRYFPELDCTIPPPPAHHDILVKLNKEKEVVFVLDISGSMSALSPNGKSRFQAMKELVLGLLEDLDPAVEIGLITLGQDCFKEPLHSYEVGELTREEAKSIVLGLYLDGSTPLNKRLKSAAKLFTEQKREKAIFLCSDGLNTCGINESTCRIGDRFRAKEIKIYAFSLLLEESSSMNEYAVYDCLTKATYGELIGITETSEVQFQTTYITEPVYPLILKRKDLMAGKFEPYVPQNSILRDSILNAITAN